ncbi:MAG: leucine--tRNA ligase [Gammaproteobacteria bacterium]|nr:leucine--tRNA ligase [Gammaproteobacteria bacterium]
MESHYTPSDVESRAQQYWSKKNCFHANEDLNKEKFYCLSMFPYPSGSLHMGHVRNYTIGDVISRYQRALGKNVLQPMGWDAFGLPAENAAIKNGIPPAEWTIKNIENMKSQLMQLGLAIDWRREFATCDPSYFKWEQWFFLRLLEKGLVYKKNAIVNWDPVDNTVLANEQVINGRGWRSGALVEHKEISQWFLKITNYADELLKELDNLPHWPEQVKQMQRHWIGRSEGAEISFQLKDNKTNIKVFSTRPDTLFGVSYLAISPDHPIAKNIAKDNATVDAFIKSCQGVKMAEADLAKQEKRGIDSGMKAIHPFTNEELPVWIANFVLMNYGTGAVMSVPAHDERDFEFANSYGLAIKQVISAPQGHDFTKSAYTGEGQLLHSAEFDGQESTLAKHNIIKAIQNKQCGKGTIQYRLRDWGVSRQRYWGTPIPIIYCEQCGTIPVPEEDLPVELPKTVDWTVQGSPLAHSPEFLHVPCPKCGDEAKRETDTFDTFMESSWYYARFACKGQTSAMLDDRAKYWTSVDQYIGGIEHATMHLLYARFFHKLLRDEGLVNSDEPFLGLLTQGMVLKDGHKMSKSLGNTVDPTALIERYGADTARLFIMFAAPPEQSLEWSDSGVEGSHRFLKRVWHFCHQYHALIQDMNDNGFDMDHVDWSEASNHQKQHRQKIHQLLQQVQHDYEKQQFNTIVSASMKMLNELSSYENQTPLDQALIYSGISILLRIMAPITPHICHVLWHDLGFTKTIIDAPWPRFDKSALKTEDALFVIQVNGKKRGDMMASLHLTEDVLLDLAKKEVASFIEGQKIMKSIVVAHRHLINFVVS